MLEGTAVNGSLGQILPFPRVQTACKSDHPEQSYGQMKRCMYRGKGLVGHEYSSNQIVRNSFAFLGTLCGLFQPFFCGMGFGQSLGIRQVQKELARVRI